MTMHDTTRPGLAAELTPSTRRAPAPIDPRATVNEVMQLHPVAVRVFNAFGVDACCGGAAPLAEAALDAGIPLDALLGALDGAIAGDGAEGAS